MDSVVSTVEVASSLSGQPYTAMKIDKNRWVGYTDIMRNRCNPTRCTVGMLGVLHNILCTLVSHSMLAWLVNRWVGALSGRRMRGRISHDCLCNDKMVTRTTTEDDTAPNMTCLHPVNT